MLKTAKNCGFPPNHYNAWKKDATDFFHEGFKLEELREGIWVESEAGWKGVESLLRFALWLVIWGQETTHASFMGVEELWMPMIFPREDGGKALVFSEPMLSDDDGLAMVFQEMAVFVPSCLMVDGYERLGRCWILNHEKKDIDLSDQLGQMSIGGQVSIPDVLVRKARAFSDVPLTGEGSGWREVNPLNVYGSN